MSLEYAVFRKCGIIKNTLGAHKHSDFFQNGSHFYVWEEIQRFAIFQYVLKLFSKEEKSDAIDDTKYERNLERQE